MTDLTREETLRYSRHLIMPEVGPAGQMRLKQAKVLLVGAGGLGSPSAMYLAAAGVGTIGLVDFDVVDLTNLQRQVVHGDPDIGRSKLDSAADKMRAINPHVTVVKHPVRLSSDNALEIFRDYDVVADGTDNFPTRYLVNDACVLLGKPNAYGSIFRFDGQASVFGYQGGPCYRCLYPEPPPPGVVPSCAEGGVLGILPGVIGLIQSTEVVKIVLGIGETLSGRLLLYDALGMHFRELRVRRDPDCPVCGDDPTVTALIDYVSFCGVGGPVVQEVDARALQAELASPSAPVLLDVREPHEVEINWIEGARHIPMDDVPARLDELDREADTVVYCLSGSRSARVCETLAQAGFRRVRNLHGGIRAWIEEVDPTLVRY